MTDETTRENSSVVRSGRHAPARAVDGRLADASLGWSPGLPLPTLAAESRDRASLVFAVSPLGTNGRIPDRSCLRALAWQPTTGLTISARADVVVVAEDPSGPDSLDASGHLRLRMLTRRIAGLVAGERVLLVAARVNRTLTLYTMTAVSSMLRYHRDSREGQAS